MMSAARIAKVLLSVIPAKACPEPNRRARIQTLFKFLDSCSHSQVRLLSLFLSPSPPARRLCRNTVHGSRASPRTGLPDCDIEYLAVRPELVEGFRANCDTVSLAGEGKD